MSRTIRRKGWNYFESAKYVAAHQNPYQWVGKTMTYVGAEDHLGLELWENDIAKFIHRDIKRSWRWNLYKAYINHSKYGIRRCQREALRKVLLDEEYLFHEKSHEKFFRGVEEWAR